MRVDDKIQIISKLQFDRISTVTSKTARRCGGGGMIECWWLVNNWNGADKLHVCVYHLANESMDKPIHHRQEKLLFH